MRQANRVFLDAPPENPSGNLLLIGKAAIEPVDENVRVNESGHGRRGPPFSNPCREAAVSYSIDACGAAQSPGRTSGVAPPDLRQPVVSLEE